MLSEITGHFSRLCYIKCWFWSSCFLSKMVYVRHLILQPSTIHFSYVYKRNNYNSQLGILLSRCVTLPPCSHPSPTSIVILFRQTHLSNGDHFSNCDLSNSVGTAYLPIKALYKGYHTPRVLPIISR